MMNENNEAKQRRTKEGKNKLKNYFQEREKIKNEDGILSFCETKGQRQSQRK